MGEPPAELDEFLSVVSHELKTPLTPLKALAQLIRARIRRHRTEGRPLDMDALDRNLATIERQVDRMNGLVNDLLEVSRAGRGRFELVPAPLDLAPLVRQITQRFSEAGAEEKRHTFVVDAPSSLTVSADQGRIEQALTNLVGNAVKFSPRGGEVSVRLSTQDGQAVVEVRDAGIGLRPEDVARIGRAPFVRATGRAETFAGLGIGLYVARLVIEGHGGTLELASEGEDTGTTVRAHLPLPNA